MSERPSEARELHTRIMKCALEVEDARAYWRHADVDSRATPTEAFEAYWFGARSLARIEVLLANLRARFDAFPSALWVLHRWPAMTPETRRLICHWHLQLADPLYRALTGSLLVERRDRPSAHVSRDVVVRWVGDHGRPSWTMSSRIQFASKLLSAAMSAGLVEGSRDPRPLTLPKVPDDALAYLLYLLRETEIEGTLLDNPYLRSVGLQGADLDLRLRALPSLGYEHQADLRAFHWQHQNLQAWAVAEIGVDAGPRGSDELEGAA